MVLVALALGERFRDIKCSVHDPKVMDLNIGWVELRVRSTQVV